MAHDRRVRFLQSLAALLGCWPHSRATLPDGKRPDVLASDPWADTLFIGEAKHAEDPGSRPVQGRLQAYLSWMAAHVRHSRGPGVCVLCFGRESQAVRWRNVIESLAQEVGLVFQRRALVLFGDGLVVLYFVTDTPAAARRVAPREHHARQVTAAGALGQQPRARPCP